MLEIKSEKEFNELLNSTQYPILCDFWASWCGPCRAIVPILDELNKEIGDRVIICKINVDNCGSLSQQYQVASIPTLIVFRNKEEVKRMIGITSLETLRTYLNNLCSS